MHADLVVLSGSRTALGRQFSGEGLLELDARISPRGSFARVLLPASGAWTMKPADLLIEFYGPVPFAGNYPAPPCARPNLSSGPGSLEFALYRGLYPARRASSEERR